MNPRENGPGQLKDSKGIDNDGGWSQMETKEAGLQLQRTTDEKCITMTT